ncbi:MAG: PTS sugar transporter subunit IIA [Deltaproteobacteria bacterium]|nr:PTS sugar transporter subunit IIA [Deltaproteobacteria bacterium]
MDQLSSLFDPDQAALGISGGSYVDCLGAFLTTLVSRGVLTGEQRQSLEGALMNRESLGGTGLGRGVAVPHAYLDALPRTMLLVARLERPVQHPSPDGIPVDLLFILCGPTSAQGLHLVTLARLVRLLHDTQLLEHLRQAASPEDLFSALEEVELRRV